MTVPIELVQRSLGLALDMGGSTMKCVYCSKENQNQTPDKTSGLGHIHLVSYGHLEVEQGLKYLSQHIRLRNDGTLFTTGVGCTIHGSLIKQSFDIKFENLPEYDCFVKAFRYFVDNLPRKYFLEPFQQDAIAEPMEFINEQITLLSEMNASGQSNAVHLNVEKPKSGQPSPCDETSDSPAFIEQEPDIYPCMLVMCGSGFAFMKLEKDGTFGLVDGSSRGGKAFYGIGKLLTGCESFDELMKLAEEGKSRNVDTYSDDLFEKEESVLDSDSSIYKLAKKMAPSMLYSFGKAAADKPVNFRREDIARAWLNHVALDLVQCLHNSCQIHGVKRAFFCGGFCDSSLI
jgi:pantothenate kinase